MKNIIDWHIEGRLLRVILKTDITKEVFLEVSSTVKQELDTHAQPPYAHIILDARERGDIHKDMLKLQPVMEAINEVLKHPQMGWLIAINPNPNQVMKFLLNMSTGITRTRFRIFETIEEAYEFLRYQDQTLPNIDLENRIAL